MIIQNIVGKKGNLRPRILENDDNQVKKELIFLYKKTSFYIKKESSDIDIKRRWFIYKNGLLLNDITCKNNQCNNQTSFQKSQNKFKEYCNRQCMNSSTIVKSKRKETNNIKYGGNAPTCDENVKNKMKKTFIANYGVSNPMKNESIKNKLKETNNIKYGGNAPICDKNVKNKMKKTTFEKYGVYWFSETKEHSILTKQNNLKKYGTEYYTQSNHYKNNFEKILAKKRASNLKKYGASEYTQSNHYKNKINEIQLKMRETSINIFNHPTYSNKHLINFELWDDKEFIESHFFEEDYFMLKDFCQFFNCNNTSAYKKLKLLNISYKKYMQISRKELEIIEILEYNFPGIIIMPNTREIITPFEIDIYLPEFNMGIEYNGCYWHSIECSNNKTFLEKKYQHQRKSSLCNDKGIRLIHIYEDYDVLMKLKILFNIIQNNIKFEKIKNDEWVEPQLIQLEKFTIYDEGLITPILIEEDLCSER